MNNHNEEEILPHEAQPTLTLNRLIALCAVGVVIWLGIIRIGVGIWEVM